MTELTPDDLERTAATYEELMVPTLFEPWVHKKISLAEVQPSDRVLDVACGTGAVARAAADRTAIDWTVCGLDPNPGMLAVAEEKAPGIVWKEGVAEEVPCSTNAFDVVFCQFGMMFFEDPTKALREMSRVLAPGGRCIVSVFDSLDYVPGYNVLTRVFEQIVGAEVAQALQHPFSMGNKNELQSICDDAELSSAKITTHEAAAHFPDVRTMVLADVKGWFPFAGIELDDEQIEHVIQQAESALDAFIGSDGQVSFPVRAHFIIIDENEV